VCDVIVVKVVLVLALVLVLFLLLLLLAFLLIFLLVPLVFIILNPGETDKVDGRELNASLVEESDDL
jgi:PDZ domain-containing secreted protein